MTARPPAGETATSWGPVPVGTVDTTFPVPTSMRDAVASALFRTMSVPVMAGRGGGAGDAAERARAAEAMKARMVPDLTTRSGTSYGETGARACQLLRHGPLLQGGQRFLADLRVAVAAGGAAERFRDLVVAGRDAA